MLFRENRIKSTWLKTFKRSFNIPFTNIYLERINFRKEKRFVGTTRII